MSDTVSLFVVKGTLALLGLFSIATWALVIVKALQGLRVRRDEARFEGVLGESALAPSSEQLKTYSGPTARVALAGLSAWEEARPLEATHSVEVPLDILERSLKRQIQKERRSSENGLALLASIGTTSPFVGLFGTVWGIMHALRRISGAGSASLDVVAGPIGEALVATGIGIAVAVPAVLSYNFFVRKLKVQAADLEDFANWLVTSLLKHGLRLPSSERTRDGVVSRLEARAPLREART
jgi:biopolymer transport protein ExbB